MTNADSFMQTNSACQKYNFTAEQKEVYEWLKGQKINTDDDTLSYWSRKYHAQRVREVVNFAHARRDAGEPIRNIGGWIHKLLKSEAPVVNSTCKNNREHAEKYRKERNWTALQIYEKYVKDEITGDDLSLTMVSGDFDRALEALCQKSELYKEL